MSEIYLCDYHLKVCKDNPATNLTTIYAIYSKNPRHCALRMDSYDHRTYRQVDEQNPKWYREFCARYSPSRRAKMRKRKKPDTYIKRAHTLRALGELASGRCRTVYAVRLLPFVKAERKRIKQNGGWIE